MGSPEENALLKKFADLLLAIGKDLFTRGTVKDAVAWEGRHGLRVAWVMNPKRMYAAGIGHDAHMPFYGRWAAAVFERHGLRAGIFEYEHKLLMNDFLERAANTLYDVDEDGARITIIPEPGYPWPAPDGYWSAKKNRLIRSDRPEWILPENVVDAARHIDSPGVDLCKLIPEVRDGVVGAQVATYGRSADDFFIVTHAMGTIEGMTRYGELEGVAGWAQNARHVVDCGGLLFPSMSVGKIPATNFGVGVLIADVGVVLNSLKPYLKRGMSAPSLVYSSDAWTGRTGSFMTDSAISAFEQLHGHSDYMYYVDQNIWPLGAPRAWAVTGPGELADEIYKTSALKRELRERFSIWTRGLEPEEILEMTERVSNTKSRYGYLEAKVNGVMQVSDFPIAAVPPQQEEGFRRFLEMTGFNGELLIVDLPDEVFEVMQSSWNPADMSHELKNAVRVWAHLEYGWNVSDAVRRVGRKVAVR